MCKHVLNAQVTVRAPCCKRFFDCPRCHEEQSDHPLARTTELAFVCKKCKRAFRKDLERYEEGSDDFCPHCDNCYVVDAKLGAAARELEEQQEREEEEGADAEGARAAGLVPDARQDSTIHQALDPRQRFDPRRDFRMAGMRSTEEGSRIDVDGLEGAVRQGQENEERRKQMLMQANAMAAQEAMGANGFDDLDQDLDWS